MVGGSERLVEHPEQDLLDVPWQWIAGAQIDILLVHLRVRHVRPHQDVQALAHITCAELEDSLHPVVCALDPGAQTTSGCKDTPGEGAYFSCSMTYRNRT